MIATPSTQRVVPFWGARRHCLWVDRAIEWLARRTAPGRLNGGRDNMNWWQNEGLSDRD